MIKIAQENSNSRRKKRVAVLIVSGIFLVIILPFLAVIFSINIESLFNIPKLIPIPYNIIVGIIIFPIGFYWSIWANIALYKIGNGTPVPLKDTQTTKLVIIGPYKYSRNPMVFGYLLLWFGLGFIFNSIILLFGFTVSITLALILFVKIWEEKNLEKRFGKPYLDYKESVSFIIPLPRAKNKTE
ncbi:MAG: methyltransferase family protein [Promethearchaeota archaeon]